MSNGNHQGVQPGGNLVDLPLIVHNAIADYVTSDELKTTIEGAVKKKVDEQIRSVFTWGAGKDTIENGVKEMFKDICSFSDWPNFSDFFLNAFKTSLEEYQLGPMKELIDKKLGDIFQKVPEELTLTEILNNIRDIVSRDLNNKTEHDGFHHSFELEINKDAFRHYWIEFNVPDLSYSDDIRASIFVFEDRISSIHLNGDKLTKGLLCSKFGVELFLNQLSAAETRITLDHGDDGSEYDCDFYLE